MEFIMKWIESVVVAACCAVGARHYIHMLQLESYQLPGYQRWLTRNFDKIMRSTVLIGVLFTVLGFVMHIIISPLTSGVADYRETIASVIVMVLFAGMCALLMVRAKNAPAKKPLVMTKRAKRLYAALCILTFVCTTVFTFINLPAYIVYALIPYLVYAAEFVEEPVEKHINAGFFKSAQQKLNEREDLIKIGITGSYGKTSTKFALRDILSVRYNVLATPSSFNTPMGHTGWHITGSRVMLRPDDGADMITRNRIHRLLILFLNHKDSIRKELNHMLSWLQPVAQNSCIILSTLDVVIGRPQVMQLGFRKDLLQNRNNRQIRFDPYSFPMPKNEKEFASQFGEVFLCKCLFPIRTGFAVCKPRSVICLPQQGFLAAGCCFGQTLGTQAKPLVPISVCQINSFDFGQWHTAHWNTENMDRYCIFLDADPCAQRKQEHFTSEYQPPYDCHNQLQPRKVQP